MVKIVKTAMRQLAIQRHLTTLKPRPDAPTGTSRLTLTTATRSLTSAASLAAADPFFPVHRSSYIL